MSLRNLLYDRHILPSAATPQFSVVVGNLTVGGTGKTPMVEYLITNLSARNRTATLSRGYGRKTRGFVVATSDSTAEELGDEPLQYYEKFGVRIKVAVCENRVLGSLQLHRLFPSHTLLLLDDAYQHRALRANRTLLLNDYNRPFYQDSPFPGGRLRETRRGAGRADAIITTKCPPDLSDKERGAILQQISRYAPGTPCFFAGIRYGKLLNSGNTAARVRSVSLVAGIAQPGPLIDYLKSQYRLMATRIFPDHHHYTEGEVREMVKYAKKSDLIVTTEKDWVKLRPLARKIGASRHFGVIPIEVDFGRDKDAFHKWLEESVENPLRARRPGL